MSLEDAQRSARFAALAMLASLRSALGDFDRVAALNLPVVISAEVEITTP